jgi:hypothetical protein
MKDIVIIDLLVAAAIAKKRPTGKGFGIQLFL